MAISIKGMDKVMVVQRAYARAKAQGMGVLHYRPGPLSRAEAEQVLKLGGGYIDYLNGRVMKIDVSGDEVKEYLYDRDNGAGALALALATPVDGEG